ncbi:DUF2235 domain-containing protein [Altererythrobacter sp.]|nr:DUF2235 domain-containing protein [Altererythrobacter sp.]
MKRVIICCDGTWQSLDNDWPTNVQRIGQFVVPSTPTATQTLYYDQGVGLKNILDRITGGAFGQGLDGEIEQAYSFLSLNYEEGDEIYLFGFSRGAYTIRSLAGLIRCCGIVRRNRLRAIPRAMTLYRDRDIGPDHDECVVFRKSNTILGDDAPPKIHFLGCFDTVGSLGIPDIVPILPVDNWMRSQHEFHDTQLNSYILTARHAVAIDERRKDFDITRMRGPAHPAQGHSLDEKWFPGTHTCVGGGIRSERALSDGPLLWMIGEAREAGLAFNDDLIGEFTDPDPLAAFNDDPGLFGLMRPTHDRGGPQDKAALSDEALRRWNELTDDAGRKFYRPKTISGPLPDPA